MLCLLEDLLRLWAWIMALMSLLDLGMDYGINVVTRSARILQDGLALESSCRQWNGRGGEESCSRNFG